MCHGHSKMECPGLDPAIIFMVDAERLHTCMQYLSGHPSGTITITPTLQIGANSNDSMSNFFRWLDLVVNECNLPCCCRTTGFNGVNLNGIYHHLSPGEANYFIKILQQKLKMWASKCTDNGRSAGSVLRCDASGKGQLCIDPELVGPFQD